MAGRPLVIAATVAEAQYVPQGVDLVVCGIGKVDAAIVTTEALARSLPSTIVNIGTAGALRADTDGLFVPSTVINHDLSVDLLRQLGYPAIDSLTLKDGDGSILATGDTFVTDVAVRDALAGRAQLVDMEGFAIAAASARFGVSCRLVKHVSDQADDSAMDWPQRVDASARILGQWLRDHL